LFRGSRDRRFLSPSLRHSRAGAKAVSSMGSGICTLPVSRHEPPEVRVVNLDQAMMFEHHLDSGASEKGDPLTHGVDHGSLLPSNAPPRVDPRLRRFPGRSHSCLRTKGSRLGQLCQP
jgi:hypothetical protein